MATTTMADLCEDLVVEILSRVPLSSLRSVRHTCKKWNALSKSLVFGKLAEGKNHYLGFVVIGSKVYSLRCDFQGIRNDGDDFVDLSIKQVSVLNQILVCEAYQCDGLFLCVIHDIDELLIWNPYLGQTKWILQKFNLIDRFFLGYDSKRNHKILKISLNNALGFGYDIYEFGSNSWRILNVTPNCKIPSKQHGVTLKGNVYFYGEEMIITEGVGKVENFLVCFDFTSERFGPLLSLPFHFTPIDGVTLSCIRDEKLAVLHQYWQTGIMEIWVTSKIDYNKVLWTKFLEVDTYLLTGIPINHDVGGFFIDDYKKVAVVFDLDASEPGMSSSYQTAHIFGEDGYFKSVSLEEAPYQKYARTQVLCSSYVPSLVQIE